MCFILLVAFIGVIDSIPINVEYPKVVNFRVRYALDLPTTHFFTLENGSDSCVFLERKKSILELTLTHKATHEIYTAPATYGDFVFEWPAKLINNTAMSLVLTQGVLELPYLNGYRFVAPISELDLASVEYSTTPTPIRDNDNKKCGINYYLLGVPLVTLLGLSRYDLFLRLWTTYTSHLRNERNTPNIQQETLI